MSKAVVENKLDFTKVTVIEDAHDSDIWCIAALPFSSNLGVNYATGAVCSVKLWHNMTCIYFIQSAHKTQIYSITAFLTADQQIQD